MIYLKKALINVVVLFAKLDAVKNLYHIELNHSNCSVGPNL